MSAQLKEAPTFSVSLADEIDLRLWAKPGGFGEQFFNESVYSQFCTYDGDKCLELMLRGLNAGSHIWLKAEHRGAPVGFAAFELTCFFSKDQVAQMIFLWVHPNYRKTPLGRMLIQSAIDVAKAEGAKGFFVGIMAGISDMSDKRALNMLVKHGFTKIGGLTYRSLED